MERGDNRQPRPGDQRAACVVLLPGLLCDDAVWRHQRDALRRQFDALRFVDCIVPSYGASSSLTEMAHGVLAAVQAPHFALAGHSMGGRVALEIARIAPQRVQRLALLDTGIDALAAGPAGAAERDKRMALLALARQHGMRRMGQAWASGMVHPSRLDAPVFGEILDMIARKTPAIFEAQITALLARPDARDALQNVRCPTLLLCGRQDAWSPLSRHQEMHAICAQSRLVVIEDCGHMSTMEQPAAVSDALVQWMG